MRIFMIWVAATLLLAQSAFAAPVLERLKSEYTTEKPFWINLRTIVAGEGKNPDSRLIAAELQVAETGCVGKFNGVGKVVNDRIVLRPYKVFHAGEDCTITLDVDKTGKTVKVSEKSCSHYHGMHCSYEATLTSK
jgi:hypothetical protein